jgi:hypothetical protein
LAIIATATALLLSGTIALAACPPTGVKELTGSISRHLARIGDLATNVAEDVMYTVQGEIVRQRTQA